MTRRCVLIGALELYAAVLAWVHSLAGVRTDEAKYLLDIPYPHPPLGRWLFHAFEWLPFQELAVRFLVASLVVQAVWLAVSLAAHRTPRVRLAAAACWLLAAPVLLQAGTAMMAPLTAVQGLAFAWLASRRPGSLRPYAGWVVLLWTASLFTAYQGILYLPLVWTALGRTALRPFPRLLALAAPPAVLVAYTVASPLVMASLAGFNGGVQIDLIVRLHGPLITALIGGSAVLLPAGIVGMVAARRWDLLLTFFLLCAYVFQSFQGYYAVLFLPVLLAGTLELLAARQRMATGMALATAVCAALIVLRSPPALRPDPSRETMRQLGYRGVAGDVLIKGSFGHQWQYESAWPVRRLTETNLGTAGAVICLDACPEIEQEIGWELVSEAPVTAWIRK